MNNNDEIYLVDSHCHLNFDELINRLDEVVDNADKSYVKYMQTICTNSKDYPIIRDIANKYENIFFSFGIHPNNVANEDLITCEDIVKLCKENKKLIGIGETGLDYYYENSPKDLQQKSFIEHIKAAQITNLPIIVHTRSADDDTINILEDYYKKQKFKILIHCFSTSYKLAEAAINLSGYVSISGIVTFKKALDLQESVKKIPLSNILVETDAPYLAPVPFRGKPNEPAYTYHTAKFIADLKNTSFENIAKTTSKNFFDLFSKARI